jgi:hypothetical protein
MQQRSEDTWVPTYDDEEADEAVWQGEETDDLGGSEDGAGQWDDLRPHRRSPEDSEGGTKLRAVLGVFLVVLLGVSAWWGVRALLLPSTSTPTPAAIWTPAPLALPLPSPTPAGSRPAEAALATPTPVPAVASIGVGQRVRVAGTDQEGIRLRGEPGVDYATLLIVEEGVVLKVLGGPQEADGYRWWQLEMEDGTVGWAVEDWLEPVS